MPCYQCSKCNQCGRFSYFTKLYCNNCDAEIPIGVSTCPGCGIDVLGNTHPGGIEYDPSVPVRGKKTNPNL